LFTSDISLQPHRSPFHITYNTVHSVALALKYVFAKTMAFNLKHALIWRLIHSVSATSSKPATD